MTDQEINEAVARKLGIVPKVKDCGAPFCEHSIPVIPNYCHSIAAAWEIVDSVKDAYFSLERGVLSDNWLASWNWAEGESTDFVITESANNAPMAICLAFLKLKESNAKP